MDQSQHSTIQYDFELHKPTMDEKGEAKLPLTLSVVSKNFAKFDTEALNKMTEEFYEFCEDDPFLKVASINWAQMQSEPSIDPAMLARQLDKITSAALWRVETLVSSKFLESHRLQFTDGACTLQPRDSEGLSEDQRKKEFDEALDERQTRFRPLRSKLYCGNPTVRPCRNCDHADVDVLSLVSGVPESLKEPLQAIYSRSATQGADGSAGWSSVDDILAAFGIEVQSEQDRSGLD